MTAQVLVSVTQVSEAELLLEYVKKVVSPFVNGNNECQNVTTYKVF